MGYTHYFQQEQSPTNDQWESFKKDAKVVLTHLQKQLNIVLKSDDDKKTLITNDRVNFNGDEKFDLDHETFYLPKDDKQFNFCKTAQKPYDLAVCSVLLLAHYHMPESYDIGSDGDLRDWKQAMELNAKVLHKGFNLPPSVQNDDSVTAFEKELTLKYIKENDATTQTNKKQDIFKTPKKSLFNI